VTVGVFDRPEEIAVVSSPSPSEGCDRATVWQV
jgi:hypothetical protein